MSKSGIHPVKLQQHFDHISKAGCGIYQVTVYLITLIPNLLSGLILFLVVFLYDSPSYRCHIPGCDDDPETYDFFSPSSLQFILPDEGERTKLSECQMRKPIGDINEDTTCSSMTPDIKVNITCPYGYVYDATNFTRTFFSEHDIVCDEYFGWYITCNTVFLTGILMSSFVNGLLADIYGRRFIYRWAPQVLVLAALMVSYTSDRYVFILCGFLLSFCSYGMVFANFTIGLETVPKDWRLLAGNGYPVSFSIGQALLALIFYVTRDYKKAMVIIATIHVILLLFQYILPETVRWYMSQSSPYYRNKAMMEIRKIARLNGITLKGEDEEEQMAKDVVSETLDLNMIDETKMINDPQQNKFAAAIKYRMYWIWVPIMCFAWFLAGFTYYGLIFASNGISGDNIGFYEFFLLSAFIEIPFIFMLTFFMKFMGRRSLYIGTIGVTGVLLTIALSLRSIDATITAYLCIMSKGVISMTFNESYLYTVEMFPTYTRAIALGLCSIFSRFGQIAAPILAPTSDPYPGIQLMVYLCFIVAVLAFLLPETKGHELPETLNDIDKLDYLLKRFIEKPSTKK